jgi:hypothetical protein
MKFVTEFEFLKMLIHLFSTFNSSFKVFSLTFRVYNNESKLTIIIDFTWAAFFPVATLKCSSFPH